jgi:uncharacterized SAM-binding protein YcdF (DUF218 family)
MARVELVGQAGAAGVGVWLSRIATGLVLPLGLSLALMAAGGLCAALRRPRLAVLWAGLGFSILWISSLPAVSDALMASLERRHPPVALEATPAVEAIVVVGGALGPKLPPRLWSDLTPQSDRILHAARLYRAGKAPIVMVAGGVPPTPGVDVPEAAVMAELLREWGVPESALLLETGSRNTRENCLGARALLAERGLEDVLLVTSALHMRRALATCASVGIRARPAPTDFRVIDVPASLRDWIPSASALDRTSQALREVLAFEVYRWRGWLDEDRPSRGR